MYVELGLNGGPFALNNRGPINATNLYVTSRYTPGQSNFNLASADNVSGFYIYGIGTALPAGAVIQDLVLLSNGTSTPTYATATTSSVGNVAQGVEINPGCTVTMGADLNLTTVDLGLLDVGGTLDAKGHAILTGTAYVRAGATFQDDGLVTALSVWTQITSSVVFHQSGDALGSLLLHMNSTLSVADTAGQTIGLTVTEGLTDDVSIDAGSVLDLQVNGFASGWVFRWANPAGGDHITDLQNMINADEITFTYLNGGSYALSADSPYTYIDVIPVPEPSSLLLSAVAAGLVVLRRRAKG